MLRDDFWLDGQSASDHGIVCQRELEFNAPEPDVESETVPGLNGNVLHYSGALKNVRGTAYCYCLDMDVSRVTAFANAWALKSKDYYRLETLLEPEIFRMARLVRGISLKPGLNHINPFQLEFDCKPQKYLKSGEIEKSIATSGTVMVNQTYCDALPLINVTGSGSGKIQIGDLALNMQDCDGITIDCERHRAYRGNENMSGTVSGDWPVLGSGENAILFSGGVTSLTVKPRWWIV